MVGQHNSISMNYLRQLFLPTVILFNYAYAQVPETKAVPLDAATLESKEFLPAFSLVLKTQYPIQHAIGLEFGTPGLMTGYVGFGQFSRHYVITALEALPSNNENQEARKRLIQDKLRNGFVFELGTHYHILKRKGLYAGINLQFQRFSMRATPQELVEEYDFGDTQGLGEELQDALEGNEFLQYFYEDTQVKAVVNPVQLGITLGKRFQFKKNPRLSLSAELSYQLNLASRSKLESDDFLGQIILTNFVSPILDEGTEDSFGSFNLPSLSIRLNYMLGDYVYKKKPKK